MSTKQTPEEIQAFIEREVAKAPPLRPEQRRRLARLLSHAQATSEQT